MTDKINEEEFYLKKARVWKRVDYPFLFRIFLRIFRKRTWKKVDYLPEELIELGVRIDGKDVFIEGDSSISIDGIDCRSLTCKNTLTIKNRLYFSNGQS